MSKYGDLLEGKTDESFEHGVLASLERLVRG